MAGYSTQFATDVLNGIGAPLSTANYEVLAAWAKAEGGNAAYNPFNTTQPAQGATSYNSVGVQNYTSYQQGVTATVQTLTNGYYPGILSSLKAGTSASMTADAIGNSPWGTNGSTILSVLGDDPTEGVPATTGNATASATGATTTGKTKACYWQIKPSALGVSAGTYCLDDLLWISLGFIGTGVFLLGAALVAIGSGHSNSAAQTIVGAAKKAGPLSLVAAA